MVPGDELAGGIEARRADNARRAAGSGRCAHRLRASTSPSPGCPASFDSSTASMMKSIVAMPAPAEAAAHQHVVELDLVARDAERLGRPPRPPWSGSACRTRSRPRRPRARPTRRRSAAPSARDRRSRSDTRPRSMVAALAISRARRRRACPSRSPGCCRSRAAAAKSSRPLSLSKPQALPVLRPGDAVERALPSPRTPPTAFRRARRRHRAAARS